MYITSYSIRIVLLSLYVNIYGTMAPMSMIGDEHCGDIAARNLCPPMRAFDFFVGMVAVARYLPVAKTICLFPRNGAIRLNEEDGGGDHILP